MSAELPENNPERNAWHEAGHVVVAWHYDKKSVGSVELGKYASRSWISRHKLEPNPKTFVSLAGCLAEA